MGTAGEKIERLWDLDHHCRGRWRDDVTMPALIAEVSVGELLDGSGRWYVDAVDAPRHGDRECRAYATEQDARVVARQIKMSAGGQWTQLPCYPSPEDPRYDGA